MRLPSESARYELRVRYGRYVITRLKHKKHNEMAASAEKATNRVKKTGRAVEDAAEPVQDALAERDYFDGELDDTTQAFRLKLSAVSVDAVKKPPYTQIFPQGIDYYTASCLSDQVPRYKELVTRIVQHLPGGDELRGPTEKALTAGVEGFEVSTAKVAEARTALSMARTDLEAAEDEWDTAMEKTFGLLVAEVGKKKANHYFPRAKRVRSAEGSDE